MVASKCDFCSDPHPSWVYPARSFDVGRFGWGSETDWAACEECSQLIEEDQHQTMVTERMLPSAVLNLKIWDVLTREERRQIERETKILYSKFRRARTGGRKLLV